MSDNMEVLSWVFVWFCFFTEAGSCPGFGGFGVFQ